MGLHWMLSVHIVYVKKRMGRGAAVITYATVRTCLPWLNVYVHSELYKLWTLWECSKYVYAFCCKHSSMFYVNCTNEDSQIIQKKNKKKV